MPGRHAGLDLTTRPDTDSPAPGQPLTAAFSGRLDPAAHRRYLARALDGAVPDLGAGSDERFPYLRTAVRREPALDLQAIEPDPRQTATGEAVRQRGRARRTLRPGRADSLPHADDTFDVVIVSAVFCTVQEPSRALGEVHRVLRPPAESRFFEHVRADGRGYGSSAKHRTRSLRAGDARERRRCRTRGDAAATDERPLSRSSRRRPTADLARG